MTLKGHHESEIVTTGEEAVQRALTDKFDLILMDITLKGNMDGIEAASVIREKSNVPIIYVSGNSDLLNSDRLKATKPNGIVKKPIFDNSIYEMIERKLGSQKKLETEKLNRI